MEKYNQKFRDKRSQRAVFDLVSSILVMAVGVAVSFWSLKMPMPLGWASAPGLVPLLFAGTMFLMGLGLFVSALRNKGFSLLVDMLSGSRPGEFLRDIRTKRSIWIISVAGIYILLLTGHLPFEIAGSIFLFSAFMIFWKEGGWLKITLVSLIIPLAFGLILRVLFKVLLPGDSIFDLLF